MKLRKVRRSAQQGNYQNMGIPLHCAAFPMNIHVLLTFSLSLLKTHIWLWQAVLTGGMRTNSRCRTFFTVASCSCQILIPSYLNNISRLSIYTLWRLHLRWTWGRCHILQGLLPSGPYIPESCLSVCGWTLLFFSIPLCPTKGPRKWASRLYEYNIHFKRIPLKSLNNSFLSQGMIVCQALCFAG